MTRFLGMSLLLCACGGDKGSDTDTNDTNSSTDDRFSEYVYVTEAPTGEQSCFTGGADANDWIVDTLADDVVQSATMSGEVIDFETDDPVEEATVDIFFSNSMSGSADISIESDSAGSFSAGGFLTCTPYAYRTYTDPALGDTKVTIQANRIEGNGSDISNSFNSVSAATYAVIPSLLGVSPDVDKGVVAGTAYDCNGDAYSGAQVVVRDADGNIPESLVVKYFVDNFPNRNQEWTSDDGLFVAINVPEGDWVIETWVSDGAGGHHLMGEAPVQVYADSINLSNVYVGYESGLSYPDSCLGDAPIDTGDPVDTGDTGSPAPVDSDGDGFDDTEDCDDGNAAINPGAYEVLEDGIDNNCNPDDDADFCLAYEGTCGTAIADCATWYSSAAAGSPGDATGATQACYVYHYNVATTMTEQAMLDAHCAHAAGLADANGSIYCVEDPDIDGDGSPASLDCDDTDAAINPNAAEIPDNGVDENCDPSDDTTSK